MKLQGLGQGLGSIQSALKPGCGELAKLCSPGAGGSAWVCALAHVRTGFLARSAVRRPAARRMVCGEHCAWEYGAASRAQLWG